MSGKRLFTVAALLLAAPAVLAGEEPAPAGRPVPVPKEKRRVRHVIELRKPFKALASGGYSERLQAFSALVPRARERSAAAKAEAGRLRALPEPSN